MVAVKRYEVDIHHAGTAMRFLTSYFASQEGKEVVLTGSSRMKQRPIKILVDALKGLDADIEYLDDTGYPPLKIKGKNLERNEIGLPADVSSQYISSLCLVAPSLKNGLRINLKGKITSIPYIKMTLALLDEIGVTTKFENNTIEVLPKEKIENCALVVESDWSAASYYYSLVALAPVGSEITLSSYKKDSLQGDSVLSEIYKNFGVETQFFDNRIKLTKTRNPDPKTIVLELSNAPDIAQTIAVSCLGMNIGCHLTGLHTLPIKETDRLAAMKKELEKFGGQVIIDDESLKLNPTKALNKGVSVDTYNDHRMAMAFAPLALKTDFFVNDSEVVSKSYPDFWTDMESVGMHIVKE